MAIAMAIAAWVGERPTSLWVGRGEAGRLAAAPWRLSSDTEGRSRPPQARRPGWHARGEARQATAFRRSRYITVALVECIVRRRRALGEYWSRKCFITGIVPDSSAMALTDMTF